MSNNRIIGFGCCAWAGAALVLVGGLVPAQAEVPVGTHSPTHAAILRSAARRPQCRPSLLRRRSQRKPAALHPTTAPIMPIAADLQRAVAIGASRSSAFPHRAATRHRRAAHHRRHRLFVDRRSRRKFAGGELSEPACRRAQKALPRARHHGAQPRRQRRRDPRHDGAVYYRRDRRASATRALAARHQFGAARPSARHRMRPSCTKASSN